MDSAWDMEQQDLSFQLTDAIVHADEMIASADAMLASADGMLSASADGMLSASAEEEGGRQERLKQTLYSLQTSCPHDICFRQMGLSVAGFIHHVLLFHGHELNEHACLSSGSGFLPYCSVCRVLRRASELLDLVSFVTGEPIPPSSPDVCSPEPSYDDMDADCNASICSNEEPIEMPIQEPIEPPIETPIETPMEEPEPIIQEKKPEDNQKEATKPAANQSLPVRSEMLQTDRGIRLWERYRLPDGSTACLTVNQRKQLVLQLFKMCASMEDAEAKARAAGGGRPPIFDHKHREDEDDHYHVYGRKMIFSNIEVLSNVHFVWPSDA